MVLAASCTGVSDTHVWPAHVVGVGDGGHDVSHGTLADVFGSEVLRAASLGRTLQRTLRHALTALRLYRPWTRARTSS